MKFLYSARPRVEGGSLHVPWSMARVKDLVGVSSSVLRQRRRALRVTRDKLHHSAELIVRGSVFTATGPPVTHVERN
jgi:hypothetical protein